MTLPKPVGMSARRTAIIGGLMVATGPLSLTLYSPALPTIVDDFATTDAAGKMTLTVYFAAFALAQLLCGPLSDRFGRRSISLVFFAIYVLGSLVAVFAPTLEVLFLARFIQGFGVSAGVALSRAMVRDQFVGREAVRILALINTILTITPAVAPTLGSVVLMLATWHQMFAIMAGFGLAILALLAFGARETLPTTARVPIQPKVVSKNYWSLLRAPEFVFPSLLLTLCFAGFHAITVLLPFILIDGMGLTPLQYAFALLIQTSSFLTGTIIVSVLSRRVPGTALLVTALALMLVSGAAIIVLPTLFPTSVIAIMVATSIWSVALAFISPSATAAAMAGFGNIAGAAGALTGFFQVGGGFMGTLVAGAFPNAHVAVVTMLPIIAVLALIVASAARRYIAK